MMYFFVLAAYMFCVERYSYIENFNNSCNTLTSCLYFAKKTETVCI